MKKIILPLLLLILFSFALSAQEAKKSSSVLIGENLAANISSLKPFQSGCIAGLNVMFWANKRFSFETGFEYSSVVFQTYHVDNSEMKFFDGYGNAYALDIASSAHLISVPVKGIINYGKGNVHFFSGLGLSVDYYFKRSEDVKAHYEGYTLENTESYYIKRNNFECFTASAFTGIIYDMGTNWQLRSSVSLRQYIPHPFNYDSRATVGVGIGLYYKL